MTMMVGSEHDDLLARIRTLAVAHAVATENAGSSYSTTSTHSNSDSDSDFIPDADTIVDPDPNATTTSFVTSVAMAEGSGEGSDTHTNTNPDSNTPHADIRLALGHSKFAHLQNKVLHGARTKSSDFVNPRNKSSGHLAGWYGYPLNWFSVTVAQSGSHLTPLYYLRYGAFVRAFCVEGSYPCEPGDVEEYIHCQSCILIACPATGHNTILKKHILKEIGHVTHSGIRVCVKHICGGGYTAEGVVGYTGKHFGNLGYIHALHNIDGAAFVRCVEQYKKNNTDIFKGKIELTSSNLLRSIIAFTAKYLKGRHLVPLPSILLAMAVNGGYSVRESWHRRAALGPTDYTRFQLSHKFNLYPAACTVNNMIKLFFDMDYMPPEPTSAPQGPLGQTENASYVTLETQRDAPGIIYRGKNYTEFVAWCRRDHLQDATAEMNDEIARNEERTHNATPPALYAATPDTASPAPRVLKTNGLAVKVPVEVQFLPLRYHRSHQGPVLNHSSSATGTSQDHKTMVDYMQNYDAGYGTHPPIYNENVHDTTSQMAPHVLCESYGAAPAPEDDIGQTDI
jgi:hypothetical protein